MPTFKLLFKVVNLGLEKSKQTQSFGFSGENHWTKIF